uniref:Uncharacterized protein n=1 Tax=Arundo donax TaxID=35708 RepID=A0A0A9AY93_ARUDO
MENRFCVTLLLNYPRLLNYLQHLTANEREKLKWNVLSCARDQRTHFV